MPTSGRIKLRSRGLITGRARFLESLATFAGKIDQPRNRLLAMLAPGPLTMAELVRQRLLYPPDHDSPWVEFAAQRSIGRHLDELIADGRVLATGDGRFQPA